MGLLTDLIPTNLAAEKAKFLATHGRYNPQFTYRRSIPASILTKYGLPQPEIIAQITPYLNHFSITPQEPSVAKILTKGEIITYFQNLCHQLNIPPLQINFNSQQAARTTISTQKHTLNFLLPLKITPPILEKISRHEIQTHYLRALNEAQQPWAKTKRPDTIWKRTEEGLALYNSLLGLPPAEQEYTLNIYRYQYYLVDQALKLSFSELYHLAIPKFKDPDATFQIIFRLKRGLTDTSQPGAFTKNIVYYEGYLKVTEWLQAGGHYADLYWGRIDCQEVEKLRPIVNLAAIHLPNFLNLININSNS